MTTAETQFTFASGPKPPANTVGAYGPAGEAQDKVAEA